MAFNGLNGFWDYLTGPRLYRIFRFRDSPGRQYVSNSVESYSDNIIQLISILRSLAIYSSPIYITFLYKKGYISRDNNYLLMNYTFIRMATTLTIVFFGAFIVRGIGRMANNDYKSFIQILNNAKQNDVSARLTLSRFEFDFDFWPIDYRWYDSRQSDTRKPPLLLNQSKHSRRSSMLDTFKSIPCDLLSYIIVHTIGRRMLYPGSVWVLQKALQNVLIDGRTKLIEQQNGQRFKLLARDSNQIDCILVDQRNTTINKSSKGKTLVICSEGNAGFYEIGTLGTPLEAGYSVLGWNHPGFAGSTGLPFPQNDINAIDVVIQFAIDKLGFKLSDIILFAWSIGGFPSTWAAMQYQDIKGIVLDASFDDVLPLAEAKMPQSWKPLVRNTIRKYFNLNNSAHLALYNGPVLLIRRLRDEIIITNDSQSIQTNRGNDILIKLFQNRFPKLLNDQKVNSELLQWVTSDPNTQSMISSRYNISEEFCLTQLVSYIVNKEPIYPLNIGEDEEMTTDDKIKLILYLAQKHMKDFDSTHCTPLPGRLFQEPFNLFSHSSDRIISNL